MSRIDDVRKTIETTLGTLTPAKAQQLAKGLLEPGARKDQIAKTAGDLLEWSQRNRQRMRDLVRREIRDQLEQVGVATRADLDALKKRVRELERGAGTQRSARRTAGTAAAAKTRGGGASGSKATETAAGRKRTSSAAGKRAASTGGKRATSSSTDTARATNPSATNPSATNPSATNPSATNRAGRG
jgi:polyhydroxyalkanoate synthesis regulator phasin